MKILVTGSTGFLGARLCRALIENGHEVRAFHRASSPIRLLSDLTVEHYVGDLSLPDELKDAMRDVEAVVHVAGLTGWQRDRERQYAVNVLGTRAVLEAARLALVQRVVVTSSTAALGVPELPTSKHAVPMLLDERHTWNMPAETWYYGYTKYAAELEVQRAVARGQDVVVVNPAYVLGAGDIYRKARSIIVQLASQQLPVFTDGGINVVHVADVIAGHLAALEKGKCGERYILGGENVPYVLLLQQIADVCKVKPPVLEIPSGVLRRLSGLAALLQGMTTLPMPAEALRLSGYYFYYDARKSVVELGLPKYRPAIDAIVEAHQWFKESGALEI